MLDNEQGWLNIERKGLNSEQIGLDNEQRRLNIELNELDSEQIGLENEQGSANWQCGYSLEEQPSKRNNCNFSFKNSSDAHEINIPRKGIARPQSQFPHLCVCERCIYSHGSVCLFCCRKICGPIQKIYKSLTGI